MKSALIALLSLLVVGCEKTIHEASITAPAPTAPAQTNVDTRSTAAVSGLT